MGSIDVFQGRNLLDDLLPINIRVKRKLNQDSIDVAIVLPGFQQVKNLFGGGADLFNDRRSNADFLACRLLVPDVDRRSQARVGQEHNEVGRLLLRGKLLSDLLSDGCRERFAVEYCHPIDSAETRPFRGGRKRCLLVKSKK